VATNTAQKIRRQSVAAFALSAAIFVMVPACSDRPLSVGAMTEGPALRRPFQGATTGSAWAPSSLRPRFSWAEVAGTSEYEVEIDDSCLEPLGCVFPSPEIRQRVAEASFLPDAPLPISSTAPVGRRYYWRVRACSADVCGHWSATRYVDVGRQRQDFNGDGFGDVVAKGGTGVLVYFGAPTLDAVPDWTLTASDSSHDLGASVTWIGDINSDGFPELALVAVDGTSGTPIYEIRVYAGGSSLARDPLLTFAPPPGDGLPSIRFAGDLNGDGLSDFAATRMTNDLATTTIALFLGDPVAGSSVGPGFSLSGATTLVGGCDFDGDGRDDLVAGDGDGSPLMLAGSTAIGGAFESIAMPTGFFPLACVGDIGGSGVAEAVFVRGNTGAQTSAPILKLFGENGDCSGQDVPSPMDGFARPPTLSGGADLNGDGVDDLILGDPTSSRALFAMGGTCPPSQYSTFSHRAADPANSNTGAAVASPGDMDGDGFDDAAIANPITGIDSTVGGEIYIVRGRANGPTALDLTIRSGGDFARWID
jgi:hypothetical protein